MMKKATIKRFASYLIASTLSFVCGAEAAKTNKVLGVNLVVHFTGKNIDLSKNKFGVLVDESYYKLSNCESNGKNTICSPATQVNFTEGKTISAAIDDNALFVTTCGEKEMFVTNAKTIQFTINYLTSSEVSCDVLQIE